MPRSIKLIATTAALLLVVGVAPAYADDDTTNTTEAPEVEVIEEDGDEESEGSHVNGKLLVLFGRGFDFSKGSAVGELIDEYLATFEEGFEGNFDWSEFGAWLILDEQLGLFSELSEEQATLLGDFVVNPPRNFGQLVSTLRKHHGRNEHSPVYAAAEDGETKKGKKSDNAGGDDDTFDSEDGGDEFSGNGKNSNHPNKGKNSDHPNKGGKKNNG